LAVTTDTDFGVSIPATAAGGGGAALAAEVPPLHPDIDAAAIRVRRAPVRIFMKQLPVFVDRAAMVRLLLRKRRSAKQAYRSFFRCNTERPLTPGVHATLMESKHSGIVTSVTIARRCRVAGWRRGIDGRLPAASRPHRASNGRDARREM